MALVLTGSDKYTINATVNGVKKIIVIKYGEDAEKLGLSDETLNMLVNETVKTKKGREYRFTYLPNELPAKEPEKHSGGVIGRTAPKVKVTEPVVEQNSEPKVVLIEEPAVEEPAVEEPAVEEPAVEEPAVEEPAVEEPVVEEPVVEEPAVEEPVVESKVEEPTAEKTVSKPKPKAKKKKTTAKKTAAKKSTKKTS